MTDLRFPADEAQQIVAELWAWYEDEVISTLESFIACSPEFLDDTQRTQLRLLVVDLATTGRICCGSWIQLLDVLHVHGVVGVHGPKPTSVLPTTLAEEAKSCLDGILATQKEGIEPFSLEVLARTAAIQSRLLALLGRASREFLVRYG